jgi:hypothetical protein
MQRCPAQPEIGVGHHDQMILRAAQGENTLEIRCAATINELRDFRRADEADRVDSRVIADRFDNVFTAVNDLEDALRQSRLTQQLRNPNAA